MSDQDKNFENNKKITEFSEDSLKKIAKEIVVKRTALLIHFVIYFAVNLLLVGINYGITRFENGIHDVWALWSITGWGIGLLIHTLQYIIFKKGIVNYSSIAVIYHLGIYLIVSTFLVFIDWVNDNTLSWVWWGVGPWGFALLLHIIFVYVFLPKKTNADEKNKIGGKSYIDRKIENELEKIKNKE